MPAAHFPSHRRALPRGGSIVEALIGISIASVGIAGLTVANANCLSIARAHREIITADRCLQQRSEQFLGASWAQTTDANNVRALLSVAPVNDDSLANHAEQVTVSPYPAVFPAVAPIVVTRDAAGTATIVSQPPCGFVLRNSAAVRIDLQENWASSNGSRPRSRQTSMIVAFGSLFPR